MEFLLAIVTNTQNILEIMFQTKVMAPKPYGASSWALSPTFVDKGATPLRFAVRFIASEFCVCTLSDLHLAFAAAQLNARWAHVEYWKTCRAVTYAQHRCR